MIGQKNVQGGKSSWIHTEKIMQQACRDVEIDTKKIISKKSWGFTRYRGNIRLS